MKLKKKFINEYEQLKIRGGKMFLIPFVNNHRSYSFEPKEDTSVADAEFKKWIDNLNEKQKMINKIHEETLQEMEKQN